MKYLHDLSVLQRASRQGSERPRYLDLRLARPMAAFDALHRRRGTYVHAVDALLSVPTIPPEGHF